MTTQCALNRFRGWAALWAVAASIACAVALWRYAAVIDQHASELHKIFSYAPNGVIVCNEKGSVIYANDAVKTITGFSELDLQRSGVEQVIPLELRDMHRKAFTAAVVKCDRGIEGINYQRMLPVQHKNGNLIICLVSVGNVRHTSGPHFFAFIMPVQTGTQPTKAPAAAPYKSPTLGPSVAQD